MRILHWAHSLLNENGGVEEFVAALSASFIGLGHSVALVSEKPEPTSIASATRYPPEAAIHGIDLGTNLSATEPASALRECWDALEAFVTNFSPDVIHLHSVGRGDIALLSALTKKHQVPVVFTAHSPLTSPGLLPRLRPIINLVQSVICPSDFMFDMVATHVPQWTAKRILIRNGVDAAVLPRRPRLDRQVYASGRHVSDKGFSSLIAALPLVLQRVPDARVILAGAGPDTQTLKNLARLYGVENAIEWPGWISQTEARATVGRSAMACVPSIWTEPFGLVAAEASMEGTPVVAAQSGALPEIVVHGSTGYLVPAGDIASLGIAIATVLSNTPLRQDLGTAAREHAVRHFSLERAVGAHLNHYHWAITGSHGAPETL
jgi:glycosyltransferase involved in cell wall biosynthesis